MRDPNPNPDHLSLSDTWTIPFVAVHGSLMLFVWNVWMPLGALYMRHWGRTGPNAVWIHAGFQMVGCVICLMSGAMIVFNGHAPMSVLQQVCGWPVFILTVVQMITGIRQLALRVSPESTPLPRPRKRGRRMHGRIGLAVSIIALSNSPQGIQLMAPIQEKPLHPMWLFFWVTAIGFVVATVVLEVMRRRRYVTARQHIIFTLQRVGKGGDMGSQSTACESTTAALLLMPHTVPYQHLSKSDLPAPPLPKQALADRHDRETRDSGGEGKSAQPQQEQQTAQRPNDALPGVSWTELDTAIRTKGESWVVGPGNAIIDIRQWIATHPGGQQILLDSIGTSVLRDVFPMHSSPPVTSAMSTEEWLHVSASRRENEHSTEALDKMRRMIVGYVKQSPGVLPGHFDPLEYRRYALVRKEVTSGPGATRTTYLLGLAELYPSALGAPAFFLPGHVVELRMRVSKSLMASMGATNPQAQARVPPCGWISRYYTPISGSMSRFDITVKLVVNGIMSNLLKKLCPSGYPQVQVRGPFGTPLVNPARPLPVNNGCFDHIVMLCAGSGSVAALQVATWMFLNCHFPGTLVHRVSDNLEAGAPVVVLRHSRDHSQVTILPSNATLHSQKKVQASLKSVIPWVGNTARLTVICGESDYASVTGRALFDMLSDAYPAQFQVHYRTDSLPPSARIPNVTQGAITADYLHTTLTTRCDPASTHFVVCGPKRFVDECYTVLEPMVELSHVSCLPPHTFLSRPIPPFIKEGIDPRMIVRTDAKGMQLWFTRAGGREVDAVKQQPAIAVT